MFFVYVDCKPDGTPFYIGKGVERRLKNKKRNIHHQRICAKYPEWYRGIAFMGDEETAFAKEIELIAKYRATLCNLTDGGEGKGGYAMPDYVKEKISAANKGRKLTPQQIQKRYQNGPVNVNRPRIFSEQAKKNIDIANKKRIGTKYKTKKTLEFFKLQGSLFSPSPE